MQNNRAANGSGSDAVGKSQSWIENIPSSNRIYLLNILIVEFNSNIQSLNANDENDANVGRITHRIKGAALMLQLNDILAVVDEIGKYLNAPDKLSMLIKFLQQELQLAIKQAERWLMMNGL
ncbi:hypothetical protein [Psychromonas sp. MME2]|uniref:hypothetical protein n=1 Tax=unclassified Psychromonas TaxID=2614957 RepID=UPI00339BBC54